MRNGTKHKMMPLLSPFNYIVSTPDRHKNTQLCHKNTQLCHIKMLKFYVNMDKNNVLCANIVSPVPQNCNNVCDTQNSQDFEKKTGLSHLQNSGILCNFQFRNWNT